MREKELRLALVCFGGVSLAVYMHGICTEILKLVRASAVLHGITDRAARAKAIYASAAGPSRGSFDTESTYFDLLREIGRELELRVIVDIIAGASAGGINGTMLGRALAHDLPIDRLSELWLAQADVDVLLAPEARAGRWSKMALRPMVWTAAATGFLEAVQDPEARQKLSFLLRSRWFKPPFDGHCMSRLMLDAVSALGTPHHPAASLLTSGQRLDLFVTLTDYYGRRDIIQIHDPMFVYEREHRHVLHLKYMRNQAGVVDSDFDLPNAPALAFAARATSSFPGAFPPARIEEIDEIVGERRLVWPQRDQFIQTCFAPYLEAGVDPAQAYFIDGSVLNNRPFSEAISAIHGRAAYRQVDRRLVYIDPMPDQSPLPARQPLPGFFSTLKAAISDLPRSQPVTDELNAVNDHNERVHELRAIIDGARPRVTGLVSKIVQESPAGELDVAQITHWRQSVNGQVRRDAGFAYDSYVRLKLASAISTVGRLIADIRGTRPRSQLGRGIFAILEAWAERSGIAYAESENGKYFAEDDTGAVMPAWVNFLLGFDIDYRKRRLQFLIEGQNRLYNLIDAQKMAGLDAGVVDRLKRQFYQRLDHIQRIQSPSFFSVDTRDRINALFADAPSAAEMRDLPDYANRFAAINDEKLADLMQRLAAEIDLQSTSRDLDILLAAMPQDGWAPAARYEVLVNYLGFPYWDVLTLPVSGTLGSGELREVLIDRISPADVRTLSCIAGTDKLKGAALGSFAGFLSRAYRENDYLLGRLHAVDRLIDIVCDAAGLLRSYSPADIVAIKKKAFSAILQAERNRLTSISPMIATLRRSIMTL